MLSPMGDMLRLIWWAAIGLFRSKTSLEAEILTLRHQLNVLRRKSMLLLGYGSNNNKMWIRYIMVTGFNALSLAFA